MLHERRAARVDVLFSRQGDAWRLYVHGWSPPSLRLKLDRHGEAFPVQAPDLDGLRDYMWTLDAPYREHPTTVGGVALEAIGRSAVKLCEWLNEHLRNPERL